MGRLRGRVGTMLGLLALAPLIGLTLLSFARIEEADRSRSDLSQVQAATADLVELVELEAALQNEEFWTGSVAAIRESGVSSNVVSALLGLDPDAEAAAAVRRTDALVATIDLPGLPDAVAEARLAPRTTSETGGPLDDVVDGLVDPAVQNELSAVIALAADQRHGGPLVRYARKLERTNRVRSAFSDLRSSFFATSGVLDEQRRRESFELLSNARAVYELALADLELLVPEGSDDEGRLAELENDPERLRFLAAVDQTLLQSRSGETGVSFVEASAAQIEIVAANFVTSTTVTDEHLAFVESAANVLTNEAEQRRSHAQRTAVLVFIATIVIGAVTLAAIIAATRWIVRPLTDLGRAALALTLGGSGSLAVASGPKEIRLIHDALGEAITNLERTEQQALALAEGSLDDPSLDQVVPGRFGATLHASIEQLRNSISFQEQFREQLAYEASHDGLTGLANRRATIDFLEQSLAREPSGDDDRPLPTTVFFIDLDHFKEVNDSLGHAAGDGVLRSVAAALGNASRDDDVVGRIGGDEFLVVSCGLAGMDTAQAAGERLLAAIKTSLGDEERLLGASIGVAMGAPGCDVDDLLAEADIAMLEAKKRGRDAVRLFDRELRARTLDELALSTNIRVGLEIGEFQLYYQPIVDSVSGDVLDYEALIRWDRPGVGRVSPDDYIPFAERSDLVIDIDKWVLDEAAQTLASNALDGIGVAVNISGRHLANGDLFADLTEVLERSGIDPHLLTIEITESALLGDVDGAIDTLRRIRETGVKIAIDDFGTGFTSLTHLRSLPADVLKIDQSFTSNLDNSDDANLVRLVIQTAHILRLDVVVEGVENVYQAQRVTMLGADQMQGYHFAEPKPLAAIVAEQAAGRSGVTTSPTSSRR